MNVLSATLAPSPAESQNALSNVKLFSVDVDGVLTDGGIYYTDDGNSFRKFNAKDGMGLSLLRKAGIEVAIISAGAPGAIGFRAQRLGIKYVFTDVDDKLSVFQTLIKKLDIDPENAAHMGDDINDLPLMRAAGIAISTADAVIEVLSEAAITTVRRGGDAAVREVCDAILQAQNNHPFKE